MHLLRLNDDTLLSFRQIYVRCIQSITLMFSLYFLVSIRNKLSNKTDRGTFTSNVQTDKFIKKKKSFTITYFLRVDYLKQLSHFNNRLFYKKYS